MPFMGYYNQSGQSITEATIGQTITYDLPGYSGRTLWLTQMVNGQQGYRGPFTVPMAPYQLSSHDQPGVWTNSFYTADPGQGGTFIETDSIVIHPATQIPPGAQVTPPNVPAVPVGGGGPYTGPAVAAATAPSIPGALPTGPSSQVGGIVLTTVYRFILQVSGGYATGSNHQGCSQTNSAMCDPQFFADPGGLLQAIAYAIKNGEVPYAVASASDPWALMNGTEQINPANIYNPDGSLGGGGTIFGLPWWMIAAGVAVYFLLR